MGKEVRTIFRTILITEVEHEITKERRCFYGRYDPVTLKKNHWKILNTFSRKYSMTDEEFARYGHIKEDK